jgi:hypothetical protein
MITNTGKGILAKYLIGQAPGYASYIAVGCGATPLNTDDFFADYSNKKNLDFEMFRVPITSRGYVTENGISKIVFTGELPTEERYEISEVGIYSSKSNPSASFSDSRAVYAFTNTEGWEYHTSTAASEIETVLGPLGGTPTSNVIDQESKVFQTNVDNRLFSNLNRIQRQERCRFLNNIILIRGDDSDLSIEEDKIVINEGSNHIHLTGADIDLSKNAPTDQLKLAFTVVNRDGEDEEAIPENVRILLEFASSDTPGVGEYARFEVDLSNGLGGQENGQHDFENNRYVVVTKELQELNQTAGFTWNVVDVIKVYASVLDDTETPSLDFYVCLDAVRLENVTTTNPLYGLTGYSVIKNVDARTIVKPPNTTNFIEFRFAIDIEGVEEES